MWALGSQAKLMLKTDNKLVFMHLRKEDLLPDDNSAKNREKTQAERKQEQDIVSSQNHLSWRSFIYM